MERVKGRVGEQGEGAGAANDNEEVAEEVAEDAEATALYEADRHLTELDFQTQDAALEAERVKAIADVRVRQEAADVGRRTTEDAVAALVKSDPSYVAAQRKLLEAKRAQALAKLGRDHQWRLQQQQRLRQQQLRMSYRQEDEPEEGQPEEPDAVVQVREQLTAAYDALERARTDLRYQAKVGRALEMLTEVLKADSVVAAVIPARR